MDEHFAIDVKQLSLQLSRKTILNDINFQVASGEYLAIIGPNGAGKTSLLRCMIRLNNTWDGWIKIMGVDNRALSQRDLAKSAAYVPQAGSGIMPFTVRQFLLMNRYAHLNHFTPVSQSDHDRVMSAMARTGTGAIAERRLDTLSGGERQKVMLAAALVQDSPLQLLDEPATFLDPRHEADVRQILGGAHSAGNTIVEVTHDLNAAALIADRVLALKHGRVVFHGTPHDLMNEDVLEEIFDHRFLLSPHPHTGELIVLPDKHNIAGRIIS
jgi:cobalamin transport system ATP-binding protein